MAELSGLKSIGFILFIAVCIIVYYMKILSVESGESKKLVILKRCLYVFIFIGLINTFSTTKNRNLKTLFLVMIICIINIETINHSVKKCNFPNLYKLRLYIRSIVIIIILYFIINYANTGGLFNFLYTGSTDSKNNLSLTKTTRGLTAIKYCPDMSKDDYKDTSTWKQLTPIQKNNCLADDTDQRKDIADKLYE